MLKRIKRFLGSKEGQGMTEYIIIVALIAIACVVLYNVFGATIGEKVDETITSLETNTPTDSIQPTNGAAQR